MHAATVAAPLRFAGVGLHTGAQAAMEIRRREQATGCRTPIIALTANALPEDREACFAAGMDDHVAKPVTLSELRRVVNRWLPARSEV